MSRQIHIEFLKAKNNYLRLEQKILELLQNNYQGTRRLSIAEAVASRETVKILWDSLPDEPYALQFEEFNIQKAFGDELISNIAPDLKVIIHFGWDVLCFETTLANAWNSWYELIADSSTTETYNVCIYPLPIEWYIVRAGNNLYPMKWKNGRYVIVEGKI